VYEALCLFVGVFILGPLHMPVYFFALQWLNWFRITAASINKFNEGKCINDPVHFIPIANGMIIYHCSLCNDRVENIN